jgi:hypothetical protein
VFKDQDLQLSTRFIRLEGSSVDGGGGQLWIGSEACPIKSNIKISFLVRYCASGAPNYVSSNCTRGYNTRLCPLASNCCSVDGEEALSEYEYVSEKGKWRQ